MLVPGSRPFLVHRSHHRTCCVHTAVQAEQCRMPPYLPTLRDARSLSSSISVSPFRSLAENTLASSVALGGGEEVPQPHDNP